MDWNEIDNKTSHSLANIDSPVYPSTGPAIVSDLSQISSDKPTTCIHHICIANSSNIVVVKTSEADRSGY